MVSKTLVIAIVTLLPLLPIFLIFWSNQPRNLRLPKHIWPEAYNITIQPFLDDNDTDRRFTFSGDVQIRVRSLVRTNCIILHSRDLNYSSIKFWAEKTPYLKMGIEKIRFDFNTERIIFQLRNFLAPNCSYILSFKYVGSIKTTPYGIFLKEYKDGKNITRIFIATQFEPNEARSAFPCFDEPQFKATFRFKLVRSKNMKSFSNTRRACSLMKGGLFVDTFKSTPVMSSYPLAFLIAPFKERKIDGFSVITRPEKFNQTKYCFELGQKILTAFGNYLNFSYYDMGFDQLSLVVLPDINFAGMENWGLITLMEESILYDENYVSLAKEHSITKLLAHEIAHLWFGDLVTCEWWNSLWLNEGFAVYFSYFILNKLDGNYTVSKDEYFEDAMRNCLRKDVGNATAINVERERVSRDYFSKMVYCKGASIVHMMKNIIGEQNFTICIRKYLQTYKYKVVTHKSLQHILQEYWPVNFADHFDGFFKSFIEHAGYPLITINFFSNSTYFEIIQEHYQHDDKVFTVPITFTTDVEGNFIKTVPDFFLSTKEKRHKLTLTSSVKWIIANIQASWYYRVNYNAENWFQIAEALHAFNFSGIPLLNRMQIVDDMENMFCIGKIDSNLALKVIEYLENETSYLPWNAALKYLEVILRYSKLKQHKITSFMRHISDRVYKNLGFVDQSSDDLSILKNRLQIVPIACKHGNIACLNEVKYYFENREKLLRLPTQLRQVVYCTTIREGNETIYEEFFNLYRNKDDTEDKIIILKALGCLKGVTKVIEKHFWNILSPIVDENHKLQALESLYSESDYNANKVYILITKNYRNVSDVFGMEKTVAQVISKISKQFSESSQKQDLIEFSEMNQVIQCNESLKILREAIRILNEARKCM